MLVQEIVLFIGCLLKFDSKVPNDLLHLTGFPVFKELCKPVNSQVVLTKISDYRVLNNFYVCLFWMKMIWVMPQP